MDELYVYTDGGCSGNPGPGAWAFVIISGSNPQEVKSEITRSGGTLNTTNNRMELTAVIEALQFLVSISEWKSKPVTVFTDSQYVQKGITEWIRQWKRNGWRTASKKPVKNQELWERLDKLTQDIRPRWVWVKGHAGIHYNEICDALTQQEIKQLISSIKNP